MKLGKSKGNPLMRQALSQQRAATANPLDMEMTGRDLASGTMTVNGAVNKTFILFALMLVTGFIGFTNPSMMFVYIGVFGGLAFSVAAGFKPEYSHILAPGFALAEGLFVGSITAIYGGMFEGIVLNAILLTLAVLFLMLFLYRTGVIKVTEKLRTGVMMATGAIMLVYLVSWIGHFVGFEIPFLHEGGWLGIGISLVIIGVASMNLLLDFDNFEKGAAMRVPEKMEWFFAMGLLFTLIWLYVEILRLLAILASGD